MTQVVLAPTSHPGHAARISGGVKNVVMLAVPREDSFSAIPPVQSNDADNLIALSKKLSLSLSTR